MSYPLINRDSLVAAMIASGHWTQGEAVEAVRLAADNATHIVFGNDCYRRRLDVQGQAMFHVFPRNGRRETWRNASDLATEDGTYATDPDVATRRRARDERHAGLAVAAREKFAGKRWDIVDDETDEVYAAGLDYPGLVAFRMPGHLAGRPTRNREL